VLDRACDVPHRMLAVIKPIMAVFQWYIELWFARIIHSQFQSCTIHHYSIIHSHVTSFEIPVNICG
jgi:hypothetical protein